MIAVFPVINIYYVSIFYFNNGKAKTSILVSVLRQLIIMLPVSIILVKGFHLGAMGVWAINISILASLASFMLMREEEVKLNLKVEAKKQKFVPFAS